MSHKSGVLLINLGTPKNSEPESVALYLKEFLMDALVIDIPYIFRWILVNLLIIPKRKLSSAEAYKKIWTENGSPLLVNSLALNQKLQSSLGSQYVCELGMRYGNPSIESALKKLKDAGVDRIVVVPLYPQYALSSTESSLVEVKRVLSRMNWRVVAYYIKDFFDREEFIFPLAAMIEEQLHLNEIDKVIFSFHGLPARHVQKLDFTRENCYRHKACCDRVAVSNRWCYRAQCYTTARKLAAKLGLAADRYAVTFQSRLGRREWIKPYTDIELPKLADHGISRVAVVCPSFIADCLETLEEIDIRARQDFLQAGGQKFQYVNCLNDNAGWVEGLGKLVTEAATSTASSTRL